MTQRVGNLGACHNDQPFDGAGVSLYVSTTGTVQYRRPRVLAGARRMRRRGGWIKGAGGDYDVAAAGVLKTNRVASAADPATSIEYALPAGLASESVTFDVRRYEDHVENESDNYRTVTVPLDGNRDPEAAIEGTAVLLSQTQLAGGLVKLRVRYTASRSGTVPTVMRATRTAGPTSPADATTTFDGTSQVVELTTPALSDASAYTYTIRAENAGATVTKDLITGISVTADATGPTAPVSGGTAAW